MDLSITGGRPFVLTDLDLLVEIGANEDEGNTWTAFRIGGDFEKDIETRAPEAVVLPNLKPSHFCLPEDAEELPSLDSSHSSTTPSLVEDNYGRNASLDDEDEDLALWTLSEIKTKSTLPKLLSWDTFNLPEHREQRPAYVSEAGRNGFDIALRTRNDNIGQPVPKYEVAQNILLSGLFELGLGRDSVFFQFDDEKQDIFSKIEPPILSGISAEMLHDVIQCTKRHGMLIRNLNSFLAARNHQRASLQGELALHSVVRMALLALEQHLINIRKKCDTLTQLGLMFEDSQQLLAGIDALTAGVGNLGTDEALVSHILNHLESHTGRDLWVEGILQDIACRTVSPWMLAVLQSCGIKYHNRIAGESIPPINPGNPSEEATSASPEDTLVNTVLPPECREAHAQCVKGLDLLRNSQPDHPLLNVKFPEDAFSLESSWDFIERIESKATRLEEQLRRTLSDRNRSAVGSSGDASKPLVTDDFHTTLDRGLENLTCTDLLGNAIGQHVPMDTFSSLTFEHGVHDGGLNIKPPLRTSIEMSLWPLMTVQNRFVQQACLRLLFQDHALLTHLSVQHQYQLMGNGDFIARLSHALFDPNLSSGEHPLARSKTTYETGLRLEARQGWPPAISELRLALMGILTETFRTGNARKTSQPLKIIKSRDGLPGDLSFSIRDLSDEDLNLCRDLHSIEALDFLCVSYRPNNALQSIITQEILKKYDRVFRHLIRLFRVQQVSQSMIRQLHDQQGLGSFTRKLSVEMHHFITGLWDFTTNVAIGNPWRLFELSLQEIENTLLDATSGSGTSVAAIQRLHEQTLDSILNSAYLSRKYQQVRNLIEDILRVVLRVSATIRAQGLDSNVMKTSIQDYALEFNKQATRLCGFLRNQISSGSASRRPSSTRNGNGINEGNEALLAEQLLLRLDFNGYYTRNSRDELI